MTDQTTTPATTPEATPASSAAPATPAPRSDAEAAQQQADTTPASQAPEAAKKDADAEKERQRNRTREYIAKLNRENAELRAQVEQSKPKPENPARPAAPQPPQVQDGEPQLADFNFDYEAFQRAHSKWAVNQALAERENTNRQAEVSKKQRESVADYNTKAAEFAEDHEDFFEAVGSMDVKLLTPELQFAIMGHDNGPSIAYHLAKNEDELWNLASIRADLLPAAVTRLASRLSAAQEAPEPIATSIPKPQPQVSKAPPPAPTVSGRTSTDTPPEKLTDDEWLKRERERSRKR